ncbi:MAG: metal ABC transporter substrate-binding protein [Nitrospinota bacterium]|nr:metal ABC transporter substrate-binding protein [Nitrospinota bacterium]
MKRRIMVILAMAILLSSGRGWAQAPSVVVTITPFAQIAERLAGPGATVTVMLKPGQSPHGYESTPGVVRKIGEADFVVMAGLGLDNWVTKIARAAGKSQADVMDLSAALEEKTLIGAGPSHGQESDHPDHGHGAANPHYWLDPIMMVDAARYMAARMAEKATGEEKAALAKRMEALERDLLDLDGEIKKKLSGVTDGFVALHGAWGYFARRYRLRQVGVIEESPGKAASARRMAQLVDLLKKQGVAAVIAEPQLSPRLAVTLAEETGVAVGIADPIGGAPGREGYFEMMRFNADVFKKALGE